MIEWKEFALEEVVEKFIDYRGKTPKKTASGVPLITAKIVKNGRINTPNEFIALEDYDKWMTRGIPQKGDVVMTTEAPLGEVAQLCFDGKVALAQRIITMRGKVNVLDNGFLKYMLQSPLMQHRIHSRSSGTTVIGIKSSELKKIPIPVPPIDIQKKIASILGSIDEKIELNLKMNKTLEEMAMTLYKHWFVENGDIEKVSIEEFGSIIGGGTPKTTVAEYWDGNIPWISVKDLNSAVIIETEKKITEAGLNNSSTKLLPSFSTVLSARGTIGNISIIGKEMTMNQSCYAIKAKDELDCFVFLTLKSSINTLINQSHGSVFNTITKDTLKSLELPFDKDLAIKFEKKVKPMFLQILSNTLENKELQDIRDYLLPRLLSGEIDLSQAEKQVEEVL
ncbi:MAG: restriction endonuclease subunit S [Anoxybacillus sp.]|nr:restriction endonuclease subunit S [Anoxybacillus sp.]MCL6585103.1 restriction endonuclease subunit S [Anoxybacillus sp.]